MIEQSLRKQVAGEYYNVLYGAKINYASFDICEKLPTLISITSLAFGVLALGFDVFNSKILGAMLLIIGIIGILLKPRESIKDTYMLAAKTLTDLSKQLEALHGDLVRTESISDEKAKERLVELQKSHGAVSIPSPVLLSSWYAHYKVFSEHNVTWMNEELGLRWVDKWPMSLRIFLSATVVVLAVGLSLIFWSPSSNAWLCGAPTEKSEVITEVEPQEAKTKTEPLGKKVDLSSTPPVL
jgi:hypothetical protein